MESLDGCSPTIDHQVVVETMAGGLPFAASGTLKAEGHPGLLLMNTTGGKQG